MTIWLETVVLEEQVQVKGQQAERLQHQEQLLEQRPAGGEREAHEGGGLVIRLKHIWRRQTGGDTYMTADVKRLLKDENSPVQE